MKKVAENSKIVAEIPSHREYGKALTIFPNGGDCLSGLVLNTMHDWHMGWEKSAIWYAAQVATTSVILTVPLATYKSENAEY